MTATCIVCLSDPSEADATIEARYMLPCKCKLMLCNTCVEHISSCVYHRTKRLVSPLVLTVPNDTGAIESEVRLENAFLRRCTYSLAMCWTMFNVMKDVAYVFGGVVLSLLVSGVAFIVMFTILDASTMDPRKTVTSLISVCFAFVILYLYARADDQF